MHSLLYSTTIITVLLRVDYTIRLYLWSFLTCGRADTLNPREMRHRQQYQNCTVYSSRLSVWLQHSLFVFLPQSKQKIPLIPLSPMALTLLILYRTTLLERDRKKL